MARVGAAHRRQDFVAAAVRVIAEHGAAGATTRRIAAAAQSPLASLHYLFDTKEDLLLAVYESVLDQAMGPPLPAELVGSPIGKVAAWQLHWAMNWLIAHPTLARAQAELFFWAMRNNRKLRIEPYHATIKSIHDFLASATESRSSTALLDAVARLTLHLVDGLLTSWFAQEDAEQLRVDVERACESLAHFATRFESAPSCTALLPSASVL